MLSVTLGLSLALHLFTSQVVHENLDASLASATIAPYAYVHLDWKA